MNGVYSLRQLLMLVARSSLAHVGAGATATAIREELINAGALDLAAFDELYAAARLTPGTNLLALFAALGYRIAGLRGATAAVAAGSIPAAILSVAVASLYIRLGHRPEIDGAMASAGAAAIAVLGWAGLRLLGPIVRTNPVKATAIVAMTVMLHGFGIPSVLVLLASGIAGVVQPQDPAL